MGNVLIQLVVYARIAWAILRRRPYKLSLLVSKGCNLHCQICSLWKNENVTLSLEEVRRLWAAFPVKPCWVNISGGEPMLNRELEAMLGFFVDMGRPLLITLTTNGFIDSAPMIRRVLERNRWCALYVSLSMDGDEPVHDRARGRERSFAQASATYQHLRELEPTHPMLKVGISTTISRVNHEQILPFIRRTLEHCPALTVNLSQGSAYYQNSAGERFERLPAARLASLLREVQRALPRRSLDSILRLSFLEMAIQHLEGRYRPIPCTSYIHNVLVTADLELMDCTVRFRPWRGAALSRAERLEWVSRTIAAPAARIAAIRREVRSSGCEQGCHSPCEKYVHGIAALMSPRLAPRLLWTWIRSAFPAGRPSRPGRSLVPLRARDRDA